MQARDQIQMALKASMKKQYDDFMAPSKKSRRQKSRPAVLEENQTENEIQQIQKVSYRNKKHKSLHMWMQKLENMNEILLSEDMESSNQNVDKFEGKFVSLRDKQQLIKKLIQDRRKLIDDNQMAEQVKLKYKISPPTGSSAFDDLIDLHHAASNILKQQRSELEKTIENTNPEAWEKIDQRQERLDKAKKGNEQLSKAFKVQNQQVSQINGHQKVDIENQMEFKERKKKKKKRGKNNDEDSEDERALTAEEEQILKKFDENDEEIDQMLDLVVQQLDRIKLQAENISTGIDKQQRLTKNLHKKVEVSWKKLQKKDSDLANVLKNYRSTNRLKVDACLVAILIVLAGTVYEVYKGKGYL